MAIGRISGEMLVSDLQRQGSNLSLETDLVYFDVINGKIGIKSTSPDQILTVVGNARVDNVSINDSTISSILANGSVNLLSTGTGNVGLNNLQLDLNDTLSAAGNITVASPTVVQNTYISGNVITSTTGTLGLVNLTVDGNNTISAASGNITLTTSGNSIVQLSGTYAVAIPTGNTLQRPDANLATSGMARINSETSSLEFFEGTQWISLANAASVITSTDYTGDGSTVVFALPVSSTTNATFAILDGNVQNPGDNYNVTGNVLTFVTAPAANVSIELRTIATATTIGSLQDGNVAIIAAASVGVRFYSDTTALTERWQIDLNGDFLPIADDAYSIGNATSGVNTFYFANSAIFDSILTTTSVTAGQVIGAFLGATYSSADFIIEAIDSTNNFYQKAKILAIHDGANVNYTEYGNIVLGGTCGSFTVDYNTGNLRLLVTPSSANSTVFKAHCTMTMV